MSSIYLNNPKASTNFDKGLKPVSNVRLLHSANYPLEKYNERDFNNWTVRLESKRGDELRCDDTYTRRNLSGL